MFPCWWQMAKVSSRPFCTVCERHFRTPRKFVEHMKSPEHKQQVEEVCTLECKNFRGKKEYFPYFTKHLRKIKCGCILQQDNISNHEVKFTEKSLGKSQKKEVLPWLSQFPDLGQDVGWCNFMLKTYSWDPGRHTYSYLTAVILTNHFCDRRIMCKCFLRFQN